MIGFEPQASGIRSDCSANCAITTALTMNLMLFDYLKRSKKVDEKEAGGFVPYFKLLATVF